MGMELAFRKPKKQRRLTFEEVAEHCRVGPKEVEFLVMKSMCANLIQGQIDEVAQLVMVSWVKPRILDTVRIDLLRQRMDCWLAAFAMQRWRGHQGVRVRPRQEFPAAALP